MTVLAYLHSGTGFSAFRIQDFSNFSNFFQVIAYHKWLFFGNGQISRRICKAETRVLLSTAIFSLKKQNLQNLEHPSNWHHELFRYFEVGVYKYDTYANFRLPQPNVATSNQWNCYRVIRRFWRRLKVRGVLKSSALTNDSSTRQETFLHLNAEFIQWYPLLCPINRAIDSQYCARLGTWEYKAYFSSTEHILLPYVKHYLEYI